MTTSHKRGHNAAGAYARTPTRTVTAGGVRFALRRLGPEGGIPVVFLRHLAGNLDDWDPRVIDGIAARHEVITFDNRGVGASSGSTADSVAEMASDAIAFIRALGFNQVDLIGFSLGGFAAEGACRRPGQDRLASDDVLYPDAGHGGIFQYHDAFVQKALEFLAN